MLSIKTIKRLLLLICLILGLVFLFSGVSKILWSHAFERALKMYNLDLPEVIEKSIRVFLPFAEIILGIILFSSKFRKLALFVSIIFLTSFTTAQVWVVAHGWNVPCGCFGPYVNDVIGTATITRNLIFIVIAVVGIFLNDKYKRKNI